MMFTALVRASLDGAVLVAGIWTVGRLWPRLSPAVLTTLWWCAAAKFLLGIAMVPIDVPILAAPTLTATTPPNIVASQVAGGIVQPDPVRSTDARDALALPGPAVGWQPLLLGVWAAGAALAIGVALRRWRTTAGLVRRGAPAPPHIELQALDVARALGLRRAPEVRVSTEVDTPLVSGMLGPVILLPAERFAALTVEGQRMALCHELAHVKRADLWLGCVPALAERIFFFHPLVRFAAREYALCREAACDAAVLSTLSSSPQDYGRLLLALGVTPRRTAAAAAGASWSFSTLKRRIAMLREPSKHSTATRAFAAAAVIAALAAIVPFRLSARPQPIADTPAADTGVPAQNQRDDGARPPFLNYVLFVDDDTTQSTGTREDLRTARQYRRGRERLLWFRHDGEQYLVRDPAAIEQVIAIWDPVGRLGEEMGRLGARQGALGAQQGEIGARQGRIGAEQGMLGAKQGALGARQGVLSARQAVTFSDSGKRGIDEEFRKIDDEMRAIDRDMKALDARMRELEKPMGDLNDQMNVLNDEMGSLSRRMDVASKQAEREMAVLIGRVLATGVAVRAR